ncbi:MAG: alpha-galactosidase [Actinomycetota bacterium]
MSIRLMIVVAMLAAMMPAGPSRAEAESLRSRDVFYSRVDYHGTYVIRLGNSRCERSWEEISTSSTLGLGDDYDMLGMDCYSNHAWGSSQTPEFRLNVDGASIDSKAFKLLSVHAAIAKHGGIAVTFALAPKASTQLLVPLATAMVEPPIWIERRVTLYPDSPVFEITMTLHNDSPLPIALSSYSLDEIWPHGSDKGVPATVRAYVGGSDWRDDFRHQSTELSSFDDEGEAVSFGAGNQGWFFVTERRGGAASRVGREIDSSGNERTWAGADFSRDLEDLGPLASTPPNYNRFENPAYPVPLRARRVAPFSVFKLGTVATGIYEGGEQGAGSEYASYVASYREPAFARQVLLNSFHPWGHSASYNEATMEAQADVAATLGIDTIVLDDQWQNFSGDWQWNTTRFPDRSGTGKADIVSYFAAKGIKLGLWMSPAEFSSNSQTFKAHPDWACTPIGTVTSQIPNDAGLGVWDFNNSDFRAYITGVIDHIVRDWGVHYFKFDFQTWVDCPPHDYNDYEDAFAAWVDALEAAHPDVTFSFDETNDQRMYAFESVARGPSWFDNGHSHTLPSGAQVTAPSQMLHDVWMAAPWIPPSTLGAGLYDSDVLLHGYAPDYLMPIAALTHMTFWTDLTKLDSQQRSETAWWLSWYHANAAELSGAVYSLTNADPWDDTAPAAFQTFDRSSDSGLLFAFRQSGDSPFVMLQGVSDSHNYMLTNVRDGSVLGTYSGDALAHIGISIPLASLHTAVVYAITPAP